MKTQAKMKKEDYPYVFEFYNVQCFMTNPLSDERSILARLLNLLIQALNENKMLPRLVVFMPGQDLSRYIDSLKSGISFISGGTLYWLINEVTKVISCRKEDLFQIKPGAVFASEPKIIWVAAIAQWNASMEEQYVCEKFNAVLSELVSEKKDHYVIDIGEVINNASYFTVAGHLNVDGRIRFWKEINYKIKGFDQHKVSLKPMSKHEQKATNFSRNNNNRRCREASEAQLPTARVTPSRFNSGKAGTAGFNRR